MNALNLKSSTRLFVHLKLPQELDLGFITLKHVWWLQLREKFAEKQVAHQETKKYLLALTWVVIFKNVLN